MESFFIKFIKLEYIYTPNIIKYRLDIISYYICKIIHYTPVKCGLELGTVVHSGTNGELC